MTRVLMEEPVWWKRGVIYEVYPRSFQDSNGDGIGDLPGLTRRLDHLVQLGADAVWISPIYPSPMKDFGYDVANYCDVAEIFGTLADFDYLVTQAHQRNLKVILDFVPNHTSDKHPWFVESRSSRDNPKRDWYLWKDGESGGGAPTNWLSNFGGSAWEWDEQTRQYYYHSFLKEQPDLNWRNPEVKAAMFEVLRFWLNRGVDGFRVDVIWMLIKDDEFRDNPPNPGYAHGTSSHERLLPQYTANRPEVHEVVREMRAVLDQYEDRVLIGEIYLPLEQLVTYYGKDQRGAQMPFNFQLIKAAWNAQGIAQIIEDYEAALPPGSWPNWVLGNHDQSRIASRVGKDQARVAAMLLLTLRGTPTLYYGEEIGSTDVYIPPNEVHDPAEKNQPGLGLGRDPERTPMAWDGWKNAGFTSGKPWLPLAPNHGDVNVEILFLRTESILNLYRRLLSLRRETEVLRSGGIIAVRAIGNVLQYERIGDGQRLAIFLNMGHESTEVPSPAGQIILSTCLDREEDPVKDALWLRGSEGVIVALD